MSLSYFHDHLGPVWYHSEPSEGPQTSKWSGTIFAISYSKPALVHIFIVLRVDRDLPQPWTLLTLCGRLLHLLGLKFVTYLRKKLADFKG